MRSSSGRSGLLTRGAKPKRTLNKLEVWSCLPFFMTN
nr:MAG TPA_asm: hypothetical protein [Caudoviricetes sp.]